MADKNFKVKSGLQVPSLVTAGPVVTDSSGNVSSSATLPITQGGTGQTTAGNALNALLPIQGSTNINKYLQSNGTNVQWNAVTQQTVTDNRTGTTIYTGINAPSSPVIGDVWIDNTTGNGIQLVRWRRTIASGTSTISGLDDNNLTLTYTAGNEQVYINGVLITRGQDYTATNGTSISLVQAVEVGDTVEIFGNPLFSVTDTYTQAQADSRYILKSSNDIANQNYVINGAFDIWQRGTSSSANGYATADRWMHFYNAASNQLFYRSDVSPGDIHGIRYAFAAEGTISPSDPAAYILIRQAIEDVRYLAGKTVTLSFWTKGSTTGQIAARYLQFFGSGGSSAEHGGATFFNVTNVWQRHTVTWTLPSVSGKTIGDNSYLAVNIDKNLGSTYANQFGYTGTTPNYTGTLYITGIKLEIGSSATEFVRSSSTIQAEIAACQRYFIRYAAESIYSRYGVGLNYTTTLSTIMIHLPVEMRTFPSVGNTGSSNNYAINHGADSVTALTAGPGLAGAGTSKKIVNLSCTVASGLTAGSFGQLISNNNTSSYIDFSAEI